jgi:diaminohydroxyphosphoribosylaminopyrimidine deaminase/5-amino-6-(5-phosphoribosylamino)uracil reductase
VDVSAPFRKRVATGLPWVIAKWAQTVDGRVATRTGESQWISNACSRRVVHRTRGRVDAVLTGMGTVRRDDPALTARASRPRRVAARVVVDARAELPVESRLVRTAGEAPVIVLTGEPTREIEARASALRDRGVLVASFGAPGGRVDLPSALRWLSEDRDATSVLVEAGPGLIGAMFDLGLIDEAHVFTGALALGDPGAPGPIAGGAAERLADATRLRLLDVRRVGDDVAAVYRRADGAG